MNTIAHQWGLFATLVIPKDASPVQRQEMRRAFYAGAEGLARIQYAVGDASISEDAGVQILEGVNDELRRFAAEVAGGRA
ncbi:MAG: hypothetical protein ACSLE9_00940 [Burkholderiaceae bacterium]